MSRNSQILCWYVILLMDPLSAPGQQAEAPQQFANPLEQATPAWQEAAPPDWVKPGVRLTFWAGTISIEGTRETIFIKDPRGEIYDDQGNRYRIDDERNQGGFSGRNTAGHGYTQVDIVAVDAPYVFLCTRVFVMDDVNADPVLTLATGAKTDLASGGGLWANPETLKARRTDAQGQILRGPYRLGGKVYNAVIFVMGKVVHVYDSGTGLRLSERVASQSQRGYVNRNGFFYPAPPRVGGSLILFTSFRTKDLPWQAGNMPAWVANTRQLYYEGATIIDSPVGGRMTIPSNFTVVKQETGGNWVEYEQIFYQPPFMVQPEKRVVTPNIGGPAMVGGFWIDPAQLAQLSPGQIIDRDPVTKSTLSVSLVNPGPGGQSLITVQERAPRYTAEWTYDGNKGVLVRMRVSHPTPLATTTGDYSLRQMP